MRIFNSAIIRVLLVRPFLYLWSGQVLSQLAINMVNFILLLRIAELTHSNTATALFVLSIGIPALLFGSLAGIYVDHWSKKWVLIICNFLRAILVLAFFVSSETLWAIYLFSFLASTVTQFFVPAEAPTIPLLVKGELLLSANGLFTVTLYASVIVGYMLAGPVLSIFGTNNAFLLISILFVLAGLFVSLLPNEVKKSSLKIPEIFNWDFHKSHVKMVMGDFKEGYHYLVSNKVIVSAFVLLTASQVLIATIASLAPGVAREVMHVRLINVSIFIIGPAALGMILGSVLVSTLGNFNKEKIIEIAIWCAGLFLILLALVRHFLFFSMFLLFLLGITNALITVVANTTLQEKVQDNVRGRIYGFLTAFGGFFSIFPVLLAGIFSDYFGVVRVIFIMGLGIMSFGVLRYSRKKVS